jgi:hypothetical protein
VSVCVYVQVYIHIYIYIYIYNIHLHATIYIYIYIYNIHLHATVLNNIAAEVAAGIFVEPYAYITNEKKLKSPVTCTI